MLRIVCWLRQRHLMRTPRSFNWFAVDELWSGPTFRRAQNDHGPLRTFGKSVLSCVCLNCLDVVEHGVESRGHELMHRGGVVTFRRGKVLARTRGAGSGALPCGYGR